MRARDGIVHTMGIATLDEPSAEVNRKTRSETVAGSSTVWGLRVDVDSRVLFLAGSC
jgi:hypothetical protein